MSPLLCHHHGPAVVFVVLHEGEAVGCEALPDDGDVVTLDLLHKILNLKHSLGFTDRGVEWDDKVHKTLFHLFVGIAERVGLEAWIEFFDGQIPALVDDRNGICTLF